MGKLTGIYNNPFHNRILIKADEARAQNIIKATRAIVVGSEALVSNPNYANEMEFLLPFISSLHPQHRIPRKGSTARHHNGLGNSGETLLGAVV